MLKKVTKSRSVVRLPPPHPSWRKTDDVLTDVFIKIKYFFPFTFCIRYSPKGVLRKGGGAKEKGDGVKSSRIRNIYCTQNI